MAVTKLLPASCKLMVNVHVLLMVKHFKLYLTRNECCINCRNRLLSRQIVHVAKLLAETIDQTSNLAGAVLILFIMNNYF